MSVCVPGALCVCACVPGALCVWACLHENELRSEKRDSALSWFESPNLALVNAKLFQIKLLKHVLKREKKGRFGS